MAKIFKVDGSEETTTKELTLEYMQETVGGYIQIVPLPNGQHLVCNEEGKLKNLPVNKTATNIWTQHFGNTDLIVGNVIIAEKNEIK